MLSVRWFCCQVHRALLMKKMCVLPDDNVVETAGLCCQTTSELKTAAMDVRKPRGSSFDGKRSSCLSASMQNDRSVSDPSPSLEDKRTNSDDESESKASSDARDQVVDSTSTKGLDALAAIASEVQSIKHQENDLVPQVSESQSKSPSDADDEMADKTDNSKVAPSNKNASTKRTHVDAPASRQTPSKQPSSDMHSPPLDRYGPPPHYVHAHPPGYMPPPNPYYPYGHYMPSPPRAPPQSPYYQGPYYPPPYSRHPAYPHPYDVHRYHDQIPSAPVLPSTEEKDKVPPSHKKRPSQEGLPLKKRKFEKVAVDSLETGSVDKVKELKVGLSIEDEEPKPNDIKAETSETKEEVTGSERPKKITRKSSEVVTPSPRSESRSADPSSTSISAAINDSVNSNAVKSEAVNAGINDKHAPTEKTNAPGMQSPSPPTVYSISRGHLRYPHPVDRHPRGPHYPSPLRAAQSLKHREQGLVSPPHHYPYPRHHGPHPYHYAHYYPPHVHEATIWHRHPYPHAASQRPPHAGGGAGPMPNYKPVDVVSSTNVDGLDNKTLGSPEGRKSSPGTKTDECLSRDPNQQIATKGELLVAGERRCAHIYGSMLVHFVG